jgi:hypothetical protein
VGVVLRDGWRMRIVVSNDECFGKCSDVHGACGGAESGDGDVDGDFGDGRDEVGVGDDYDYVGDVEWQRQRNDFAEGDGIGAQSVAWTDSDRGE